MTQNGPQGALVGTKTALESNTIWGSIVAGVSFLLTTFFGPKLTELGLNPNDITSALLNVATGVGILWAAWGRLRATKVVTLT